MSASNFGETAYLTAAFIDGDVFTDIFVGLSTADPGDDAFGLAEPSGNGYARVAVAAWSRSGNEVDNDAAVTFPEASGAWGTITYAGLFDASSGGNLLLSFVLDTPRVITNGITPRFSAGEFNVTLD